MKAVEKLVEGTKFGNHKARCTALAEMLTGLLFQEKSGLSAMARGNALVDNTKTFRGQLKRAYRLLTNNNFDPWELGNALYRALTQNSADVLVAVDWTKVNTYWVLEAGILINGRALPFYSLAINHLDIKGRQRTLELTMEYALAAMVLPEQILHMVVDRGFASLDYIGYSPLYPAIHRLTRLKKNMILYWDDCCGAFCEWPLEEGETVEIKRALLGRKKTVLTGVVIANVAGPWYLACHPDDVDIAFEYYQKRFGIEEQNRDLKSIFKIHLSRFKRSVRLECMWCVLGIAFALMYSTVSFAEEHRDRLSRKYMDKRKDLSWISLVLAVYGTVSVEVKILPLVP